MKYFLFYFLTFLVQSVFGGPVLTLANDQAVDFGNYSANETKAAVFTIQNSGDEALKIKALRKTCGCFKPSCDKKELKPNESATIKVAVEAYGIYKSYSKFVFVHTNDPQKSITKLRISGNAEPLVEILPQDKVFIGSVAPGKELIREFVIKPFGKKAFKLKKPVVESTHSLKATISEEKGNYRLKVVYDDNRKPGRIKSTLKIPVAEPKGWRDLEVVLYGRSR